jgi:XTP/dITP diphosphohydrolase
VEGTIATAERGSGGWGYDALFEVDGKTFAEMGESGKNVLGHRALALEALAARLAPD